MDDREIIVKLAWRSVWRNKRRTILTLLTIVVGCAMIIFLNATAKGGHDRMIDDAAALNVGHIQIHEKGFWNNKTIDFAFTMTPLIRKAVEQEKIIKGYCTRIYAGALLSFKDTTALAFIQGIDPDLEKNVTELHKKVKKGGRYLIRTDKKSIVIGAILAKNLGAKNGDTISLISQGFDGSIAAEKLTIVGIFDSGNPEYDQTLCLMPIEQASKTFTMSLKDESIVEGPTKKDYIHSLVIKIDDVNNTNEVKNRLIAGLSSGNTKLEILGWDELMPELVQFIIIDDIGAYIFDFILYLVVAFGVLNTIQMSVFERTREFGIMLAIGTRPGQVIKIILLETIFIALLGVAIGVLLGYGISYYFELNPMDWSEYSKEIAVWGISTYVIPADTSLLNITVTASVTFLLSVLFSIFPARRASKLKPVKAIRHL